MAHWCILLLVTGAFGQFRMDENGVLSSSHELSMEGYAISNLAAPIEPHHAATKGFVEASGGGGGSMVEVVIKAVPSHGKEGDVVVVHGYVIPFAPKIAPYRFTFPQLTNGLGLILCKFGNITSEGTWTSSTTVSCPVLCPFFVLPYDNENFVVSLALSFTGGFSYEYSVVPFEYDAPVITMSPEVIPLCHSGELVIAITCESAGWTFDNSLTECQVDYNDGRKEIYSLVHVDEQNLECHLPNNTTWTNVSFVLTIANVFNRTVEGEQFLMEPINGSPLTWTSDCARFRLFNTPGDFAWGEGTTPGSGAGSTKVLTGAFDITFECGGVGPTGPTTVGTNWGSLSINVVNEDYMVNYHPNWPFWFPPFAEVASYSSYGCIQRIGVPGYNWQYAPDTNRGLHRLRIWRDASSVVTGSIYSVGGNTFTTGNTVIGGPVKVAISAVQNGYSSYEWECREVGSSWDDLRFL